MTSTLLQLQAELATAPADNPLVLYHGRCADGFGAALAAWIRFEGRGEYVGMSFGKEPPDATGRPVYILDFSFPPSVMAQLDEQAERLVMLDHHITAAQQLTGFQCRCGVVHFDMAKSGAQLAWDFFLPDRPTPALVKFIQDRDLWTWAFGTETRAFCASLDMEPMEFPRWRDIAGFDEAQLQAFMAPGRAMDAKFTELVSDIARSAMPVTMNGQAGLMCNAPPAFHSDLGNLLSEQCGTFALMWHVKTEGRVKVGLRSVKDFDVTPLALSMGGGGHRNACGFEMGAERLPELLSGTFHGLPLS
jgi:hypothetical protein